MRVLDCPWMKLFLGGDPALMDRLAPGEGAIDLVSTANPLELAANLERIAAWVREMHARFPTDHVDCWIEGSW